jgi:hypothetical protein
MRSAPKFNGKPDILSPTPTTRHAWAARAVWAAGETVT